MVRAIYIIRKIINIIDAKRFYRYRYLPEIHDGIFCNRLKKLQKKFFRHRGFKIADVIK